MKKLFDYLLNELLQKKTEFRLVAQVHHEGGIHVYIHPMGKDGETLDLHLRKNCDDEIEELRKDKARLEWLIENRASVTRLEGEGITTNWFIVGPAHLDHLRGTFKDPYSAIDAAMREDGESGK